MNVIFRGNGKKKERAGRGCTCRGGLQLSSHPLCKERHTDTEKKRGREGERAAAGRRRRRRAQYKSEMGGEKKQSVTSSPPKGPPLHLPSALT